MLLFKKCSNYYKFLKPIARRLALFPLGEALLLRLNAVTSDAATAPLKFSEASMPSRRRRSQCDAIPSAHLLRRSQWESRFILWIVDCGLYKLLLLSFFKRRLIHSFFIYLKPVMVSQNYKLDKQQTIYIGQLTNDIDKISMT
jgi:hypothetical protein